MAAVRAHIRLLLIHNTTSLANYSSSRANEDTENTVSTASCACECTLAHTPKMKKWTKNNIHALLGAQVLNVGLSGSQANVKAAVQIIGHMRSICYFLHDTTHLTLPRLSNHPFSSHVVDALSHVLRQRGESIDISELTERVGLGANIPVKACLSTLFEEIMNDCSYEFNGDTMNIVRDSCEVVITPVCLHCKQVNTDKIRRELFFASDLMAEIKPVRKVEKCSKCLTRYTISYNAISHHYLLISVDSSTPTFDEIIFHGKGYTLRGYVKEDNVCVFREGVLTSSGQEETFSEYSTTKKKLQDIAGEGVLFLYELTSKPERHPMIGAKFLSTYDALREETIRANSAQNHTILCEHGRVHPSVFPDIKLRAVKLSDEEPVLLMCTECEVISREREKRRREELFHIWQEEDKPTTLSPYVISTVWMDEWKRFISDWYEKGRGEFNGRKPPGQMISVTDTPLRGSPYDDFILVEADLGKFLHARYGGDQLRPVKIPGF